MALVEIKNMGKTPVRLRVPLGERDSSLGAEMVLKPQETTLVSVYTTIASTIQELEE